MDISTGQMQQRLSVSPRIKQAYQKAQTEGVKWVLILNMTTKKTRLSSIECIGKEDDHILFRVLCHQPCSRPTSLVCQLCA